MLPRVGRWSLHPFGVVTSSPETRRIETENRAFVSASSGTLTFTKAFSKAPVVNGVCTTHTTAIRIHTITTTGFQWASASAIHGLAYTAIGG